MEKLYIDDIRTPSTEGWSITRNSKETIDYMVDNGCPVYISFDHDLGGEDTSMVIVKWMIEHDLNNKGKFIPYNFEFNVHSANPVGKGNIEATLNSYLKFRKENKNDSN